ncbi:M42 family metallopeptidase [Culicoidibacter larvae]|uniref:M42 family metallopeptidase n=1 Tax=Culicoidibacter larvae TaxID=2579976 RepID=A0A5R8QG41_9FIRM|nr:M42 family metallopeptidase [Culicoidibacter larvae]TLG76670.1 M42 family metallopeptidase [Culicoidibacter larvae]
MEQWQLQQLEELSQIPGVSGHEDLVRDYMLEKLTAHTSTIERDRLGSVFGVLLPEDSARDTGLKIMLAGHMDEVGFMVTRITENGMLKVQTIGGWWNQTLLGKRVTVYTRDNEAVPGTFGSVPTHLLTDEQRNKPIDFPQMFIDIGATSKDEVLAFGVRPGDQVIMDGSYVQMKNPKRLMAKAWDNRVGCALTLDVFSYFAERRDILPATLYGGATVQEEVGLRGAKTAAAMIKPDLALVVDCSPANDSSGDKEQFGQLGKGVLLRVHDRSMIPSQPMIAWAHELLEKHDITFQYFISPGGTDAGNVHMSGEGVPTLAICLPARYIHANSSIIDSDDYLAARQLLIAFIEEFSTARFEQLTFKK